MILTAVIILVILLLLFLYSACKISGDISREEEKFNEYCKTKRGITYEKEKS